MIVRASTENKNFKRFQNDILGLKHLEGTIGGEHLENLFKEPPPYITYDIGISENQKEIVVANIVSAISDQGLPFFEICHDINKIIENSHLPAFLQERLFEYCIFLDKKNLITNILEKLINKTPELKAHIQTFLATIEKDGLEKVESEKTWPDHIKTRAKDLSIRLAQLKVTELCAPINL